MTKKRNVITIHEILETIKNIFIVIIVLLTLPIWIIFLIIIVFSIPKDFYEKYDEHRTAEEEMFGF